jgi:hypothetical protein
LCKNQKNIIVRLLHDSQIIKAFFLDSKAPETFEKWRKKYYSNLLSNDQTSGDFNTMELLDTLERLIAGLEIDNGAALALSDAVLQHFDEIDLNEVGRG